MTRTVDATLSAALPQSAGRFIAKLELKRAATSETISVVKGFEIDEGRLTAWVKIPRANAPTTVNPQPINDTIFRISRGLNIAGTDYYFASSWYVLQAIDEDDEYITYKGHIFKSIHYSQAGDVSAQDLIATVLTNSYVSGLGYSNTITYPSDVEWWKGAQFLADGATFELGSLHQLNGMLQQKYIANLIDLGGNTLFPVDNGQFNEYEPTSPEITPLTAVTKFSISFEHLVNKYFKWKDETGTDQTQGDSGYPSHNLGYIESTITPFSLNEFSTGKATARLVPPDLRLTGEDYIRVTNLTGTRTWLDWFRIKETFDPNSRPSWYQTLESIKLLNSTEGGGMPGYIEPAVRHTQTNVSEFKRVLNSADSNLQAALNTIDSRILIPQTNSADIFRCNSSGASTFSGTIASKAGATLVYNAGFAGNENALVAANTNQLAKLTLHNTTRGTSALISQTATGTNTITLTATVPTAWAAGDTITIASQTVVGGGFNWVDLELTSGPMGAAGLLCKIFAADTGGTNVGLRVHPFSAFGNGKVGKVLAQTAGVTNDNLEFIQMSNNIFCAAWDASGAATVTIGIREAGTA